MKCLVCLLTLLALLLPNRAEARRRTKKRRSRPWINYNIGGSYKSILAHQKLKQTGVFPEDSIYMAEQRIRLNMEFSRGPWRLEIADQLSIFSQNANSPTIPIPPERPITAWQARQHPIDGDSLDVINQIDRAYLQYKRGLTEVRVGKQVIAAGVGKIFQAVSQTPRQAFVIVDPEYPVTEDAFIFQHKGSWTFETRIIPNTPEEESPSFHLVAKGVKGSYDVAMTAGRTNDKMFVGLETAGNIGDGLFRLEGVGYHDKQGTSYGQALLGLDRFFSEWSLQWELFYNGFGTPSRGEYSAFRRPHRPNPYQGKLYTGAHIDWDITPLLMSKLTTILNLNDPSALIHFSLTYSLTRNFEIMFGQFLGLGSNTSEFGGKLPIGNGMELGLPNMTYLLLKMYF